MHGRIETPRSPARRRRATSEVRGDRRARRWLLRLFFVVTGVAFAAGVRPALSKTLGISGYSGKQGDNCTSCHSGGIAPQVQFQGPQTVAVNELATFRFTVQSQSPEQQFAGLDVASSEGVFGILEGQGAKLKNGEVTHAEPKMVDGNGTATWEFTWQAPAAQGPQTLYATGLSADGFHDTRGDQPSSTTFSVLVSQLGDANCDGSVSAADLVAEAMQVGGAVSETCNLGDVDCDGAVHERDLLLVTALIFDPESATECVQ